MSVLAIVGGLAGGMGLFLLGLRWAAEGLSSVGRGVLRDLEPWTRDRRHALASGALLGALLPGSSLPIRATLSLAERGRMLLFDSMWVVFGCGLGTALAAWWVVGAQHIVGLEGFALLMAGAGVAWSAGRERVPGSEWGKVLTGLGLVLFGLPTIAGGMAGWVELSGYPGLETGYSMRLLFGAAAGLAATALFHSSAPVALLAILAASTGLLSIPSAVAWIIGGHLGAVWAVRRSMLYGNPDARRVAMTHVGFHTLVAMAGIGIYFTCAPWLANWSPTVGGTAVLMALFETATAIVALGLARPADNAIARFLGGRFVDAPETEPSAQDDIVLPELALDSLREDVVGISESARELARTFLSGSPVTDFRLGKDLESVEERSARVQFTLARLLGEGSPPRLAKTLLRWTSSIDAHRELIDLIVAMRRQPLNRQGDLNAPLRSRLQQLQWAVLHLIEGTDPFRDQAEEDTCLGELAGVEHQVRDLRSRFAVNFREGILTPAQLELLLERLDWLGATARATIRTVGLRRSERMPKIRKPETEQGRGPGVEKSREADGKAVREADARAVREADARAVREADARAVRAADAPPARQPEAAPELDLSVLDEPPSLAAETKRPRPERGTRSSDGPAGGTAERDQRVPAWPSPPDAV